MPITVKDIVGNSGGTLNYVPKFTPDGFKFGISQIYDSGTGVGINTTSLSSKLQIKGDNFNNSTTSFLVKDSLNVSRFEILDAGFTTISGKLGINTPATGFYDIETIYGVKFGGNVQLGNNLQFNSSGFSQIYSDESFGLHYYAAGHHDFVNGKVGINYGVTPTAMLCIKGQDATSGNHAFKAENSATAALFCVQNDVKIGVGTYSPVSLLSAYTTRTATSAGSSINAINLGGMYSNTAGSFPKVILYDDGGSISGFGVSAGQLDYIGYSSAVNHAFWSGSKIFTVQGDGNIAMSNTTAAACAKLDIVSTTGGVLFPRMTTTQKNAISSPQGGLVVYDTTLAKLCVYTTAWETITSV